MAATHLPPSELVTLVEVEARYDSELAAARADATARIAAARARATGDDHAIADDLATARARDAADLDARSADERAAIDGDARAEIARYDAIAGAALAELVARIVDRVVAIATEQPP